MTAVLVRECSCGNRFIKDQGCNKMSCPCGLKMCYVCKAKITGYDHFCSCPHKETCTGCHLYTDVDQRDAAQMASLSTK